jgi:O-antigen/teichoic acid export membrane protein
MRISSALFLFQLGALMVNESQLLLLAHYGNLELVTGYALLMRVYLAFYSVITLSTASFVPSFREAYARGDREWMIKSFARMVALRLMLSAASGTMLVCFGNWILRIWLRRQDVSFDLSVWALAAVLMCFSSWTSSFVDLLTILDRVWIQIVLVAINAVTTLSLTVLLSRRWAMEGVLIAIAFSPVLVSSWLAPRLARSFLVRAQL